MKCVKCGGEIGEARACRWCGTMQPEDEEEKIAVTGSSQDKDREEDTSTEMNDGEDAAGKDGGRERGVVSETSIVEKNKENQTDGPSDAVERKRVGRGRKLVIINSCIAAVLVAFIAFALTTAERWEKVDVPEHIDPSSAREVPTGNYIVTMDNISPCYVGQDWTDCINAYIAQYNAACTLPLSDSRTLTRRKDGSYSTAHLRHNSHVQTAAVRRISSRTLCQDYADMISEMQAEDQPGYYVAGLGSWGHLTSTPETETVYDIIPAQTHEAVCYLGFIGECRQDDTTEDN